MASYMNFRDMSMGCLPRVQISFFIRFVNGETGRIVFVNCKASELTTDLKTSVTIVALTDLSLSL